MAFKYATRKEVDKHFNKVVSTAQKWFDAGHTTNTIASMIWNHYGMQVEATNETTLIFQRRYNGKSGKSFKQEVALG